MDELRTVHKENNDTEYDLHNMEYWVLINEGVTITRNVL